MISTVLVAAASGAAAVAIGRRARRSRAATSPTNAPARARGDAAPVRVLMAPAGMAVALPRYVTNADGDVVVCWGWDHSEHCDDSRGSRAA